ncbi:MAG TPA: polyketide synthase dehydratase domain-containing protein, partial [Polyangiaceae bacterium]|nr:polyketide synthase dehydratase domain-containing protein [Polyangiaceae bacterium]
MTTQRKRYWPTSDGAAAPFSTTPPRARPAAPGPLAAPAGGGRRFVHDEPLLRDHRIFGRPVLVGAAYVCMGVEWAAARFGDARVALRRVAFERALALPAGTSATVELAVEDRGGFHAATARYRLGDDGPAEVAARFQIHREPAAPADEHLDPKRLFAEGSPGWEGAAFYDHPAQECYGPSLRSVERVVRVREGLVLGRIRLTDATLSERGRYLLHPAVLDACHVVSSFSLGGDLVGNHRVPLMVKKIELATSIGQAALAPCYCLARRVKVDDQIAELDLRLYDAGGRPVLTMEGFTTKSVPNRDAIFHHGGPGAARAVDEARPAAGDEARPAASDEARPAAAGGSGSGSGGTAPRRHLAGAIEQYLKEKIAPFLGARAAEISAARNFMALGLE